MDSFAGFLRQFHIMLQWANDGIQLATPPPPTRPLFKASCFTELSQLCENFGVN